MLIPSWGDLALVTITVVVAVALPIMTLVYLWRHEPLAGGLTVGWWRAIGVLSFVALGPLIVPLYWTATLFLGRPPPVEPR